MIEVGNLCITWCGAWLLRPVDRNVIVLCMELYGRRQCF